MDIGCLWYHNVTSNLKTRVPLKSLDVDVEISGFIAHVSSTLKYVNTEKDAIEAVFTFPIDDSSAVYKFEAEIDGRKIVAECQEKQQARETYDDAVSSGQTALLLEEHPEAGDVFVCTVGNLPPGVDATVRFAYVQELALAPDSTAVQFTLPCVFVPRYRPQHAQPAVEGASPLLTDSSNISYSLTFHARVMGAKVSKVSSESDKIDVNCGEAETKVSLAKDFKFEHDLKLLVEYNDAFKPMAYAQRGEPNSGILKEDIVMLNFMPELKESDFCSQHEFVFIIDRSGSMRGSNIQNAAETLLLLLKSLPTGCYFNVCSFGSNYDFLFPTSREYSEKSLGEALDLQKSIDANYGGTEVLRPLQHIYGQKLIPTHTRQLILLTDGAVSNTHEVIALVKKNSQSARMFAIGIGEGASTALVKGIARAGNGKEEFVYGMDRLQAKVMKILKQAMQGALRDVSLNWSLPPELKVTVLPEKFPAIFSGDKLVMYAVIKGAAPGELHGNVSLQGNVNDRPVEFDVPLARATLLSNSDTQPLHRMAAKAQIKLLEDQEVAGDAEVENVVFGKMKQKDLVVLLSVSANVASRHTSFVGVDKERREKVKGPIVTRRPHIGTRGHAHSYRLLCYSPPLPPGSGLDASARFRRFGASESCLSNRSTESAAFCKMSAPVSSGFMSSVGSSLSSTTNWLTSKLSNTVPNLTKKTKKARRYCDSVRRDIVGIVSLQGFQGNWELNQHLAEILNKKLDELTSSAGSQEANVWATVLALSWLHINFAGRRDEWEMLETKALTWLSTRDLRGQSVDHLLEQAKGLNLQL